MNKITESESRRYRKFLSTFANIKNVNETANSISRNLKSKEKSIEALLDKLEGTINAAKSLISNYTKQEGRIRQKLDIAESFYVDKFSPLRKRITDRGTGLKKTLDDTNKLRDELKTKRTALRDTDKAFNKSVKDFEKVLSDIRKIEVGSNKSSTVIERNEKKIISLNDKANIILEELKGTNKSAKITHKEISVVLDIATNDLKSIESIKKQSTKVKQQIDSFHEDAQNTNDKISELYEIVTNKSIAGAFDERKKSLAIELAKWRSSVSV